MFIAVFAKEFGTGVSRAKKWKVWCSGGEPVNSCCQKGMWLLWKPLKIDRKGRIILLCRCKELQGRLLAGREERFCVHGWQECSVLLPLIHADSGSLFSSPWEWLCYNNFGTVGLRLTRKAFEFLFTPFLEMKKYSIYSEFWRLGKLISCLAAACWCSAPLGNKDLDFLWGFIWKRCCKGKILKVATV